MSRPGSQDSFSRNLDRGRSQVRFAPSVAPNELDDDRGYSNSGTLDKLTLSNNSNHGSRGNTLHGPDSMTPQSSLAMRSNPSQASNPQAKMNRNRSISKSFSSLELQFAQQQRDKYDTFVLKVFKGLFALFVMVIVTLALILAKTSLVYIASSTVTQLDAFHAGNTTSLSDKVITANEHKIFSSYIVQMLCIIIVPLILNLFSNLMYYWVRETKEKQRDPKAKRVMPHAILLIGFIEGIIEAVGISIFVMMVFPLAVVDDITRVFLLNGLCTVPIICGIVMKWNKWLKPVKAIERSQDTDMELHEMENGSLREPKKKKDGADLCSRFVVTGVQILFLLMQLAGIGLYMYKTGLWWEIPVALCVCSVSFWKNFVFIDRMELHWAEAFKRHRYASAFVKTLTKIAFILMIICIITKYKYAMDVNVTFGSSFFINTIVKSSALHYALIGTIVAYGMVWVACLACMQVFCFALPILIATPLSVFYQTFSCHNYIFGVAKIGKCSAFYYGTLNDAILIAAGILLWVSFIIVSGHLWQGIDKRDANQNEEDMWAQPETISCVFTDQSLALNRNRNPKVVKSLDGDVEYGFHAHRTYITTTMYHETKTEMSKLVMSLLQIDAEIPTEDKVADYYECHIIFDDAFLKKPNPKPDHFDYSPFYNEYVFYLLDILQDLKLKKLGDAVVVWYGEVLTFKFALGMKLVIHLKDVSKIKQKKRWSQILYMHVILEDCLDNENKLGMLDSNTFILMIDGDTQFTRKSINMMRHMIELDRERSGAICGRIFPEGSSQPVVWYQKFEYAVGHWFQKTAEHVFGTVLCSPGCFSLVRIAALYRRSGEDMDGEHCAIEPYAKEVESAMDVLKFDQGEDRMLSTLIIKNGWRLQYCAGAHAGTFCPEGFGDFFKQRRRWISSTLANLYYLIAESGDIVKVNTSVSPPFVIYTAGTFASSIFGPATVILIVIGGMAYAFFITGKWAIILGVGLPLGYALICLVFNLDMESDTPRKKSKKIDIQIAAAFILCALYALLMAAVMIGVAGQMVISLSGPDSIFLLSLVGTFFVTATLHGEFWLLIYGFIYLFFLPTMYLILIMFAVANTHDQSWGTRDNVGGSKETDADKFISITKVGTYIRDIKQSFREALLDEKPKEDEIDADVDPWKRPDYWRRMAEDDGKEEIVILEEERRRLEEEKKKQEEEKRKQEEERKLREIERQKEEARKKKLEAEERERLQERLKQERRRGINHRYKDHLSTLSRRLKSKVMAADKASISEKEVAAKKIEQIRSLAALQQMCCFLLFLVTIIWLILVVTVGLHAELYVISTNAVGLMFLIAFGLIQALQFLASIVHRLETMFNAMSNIPMSVDCRLVDEGRKYEKMMQLKQQAETEGVPRERVAAKVARKLLMVDKRTATKANLFNAP